MAWYVTGDCHGDSTKLFNFIRRYDLTDKDNILVLGDMGIYWRNDRKDVREFINQYETYRSKTPMLYFIDGNHENFKLLKQLPLDRDGLGLCSAHIRYIPRGTVMEINSKKCLFMGGADSIDKFRRTPGLTWWEDETISQEDIDRVPAQTYSYVFTHACPLSIFNRNKVYLCTLDMVDQDKVNHNSEQMLDQLQNKISFTNWYFGHYHADARLDDHFRCFLNDFEEIL